MLTSCGTSEDSVTGHDYSVIKPDGDMRIQVTATPLGDTVVYAWQRLNSHGQLVAGSGPLRNGATNRDRLLRDLKKRFPKDRIEGLGE